MHVLVLSDTFHPCPRASSQRVLSFAQALSLKEHKVTIITGNRCIQMKDTLSNDFSVYDLKCPLPLLSISGVIINPLVCLLYFFMSVMIALKEEVQVVLSSVPNGETAIAGVLLSKLFNTHFFVDMRDLYPPPSAEFPFQYVHIPSKVNKIFISLFNVLYKHSDRIVCVNTAVKETLETYGIPPKKTVVILNGADTSIYQPSGTQERERIRTKLGLPSGKFTFVYAGSLASLYPMTPVILGAKELSLKKENFLFLAISHKSYGRYAQLTSKLRLQEYVRFMGPLSVAETAEILSACDVGIVVYRGEPLYKGVYGTKVFSYMSCGLPVLASGPSGSVLDDLIHKHGIGLFIGRPDQKSFAEGFSYFLDNRSKVKGMGRDGRKVVEKYFDRRKLGAKLVSLVDELCAHNKKA